MQRLIEFLSFPAILCRHDAASAAIFWENSNAHWKNCGLSVEKIEPLLRQKLREATQNSVHQLEFSLPKSADAAVFARWRLSASRVLSENRGENAAPPGDLWLLTGVDGETFFADEEREWAQRIEQLDLQHERDEVALRLARRHLQAFFDDSASGKAFIGLDGELFAANDALSHTLRAARAQRGEVPQVRWTTDSREVLLGAIKELRAGGQPISGLAVEVEIPKNQGAAPEENGGFEAIFFLLSLSLVRDSRGRALYVAAEFSDVTQSIVARRALDAGARELEKINRELARSNSELERFAFVASHDLQEPLRKICVFGERLEAELKKAGVEGTANTYLSRIVAGAQRMTNLISAILEYSRLSQTPSRPETVDLAALLDELARETAENLAVRVGKMPTVAGNRSRLTRLFENLLSNAHKFRRENAAQVCIEWRDTLSEAQNNQKFALIEVRDNGIGFDSSCAEKIFEVFARLHSRETYAGTGIGLAICRRIARENGGEIWAVPNAARPDLSPENAQNGATFWLKLPLAPSQQASLVKKEA